MLHYPTYHAFWETSAILGSRFQFSFPEMSFISSMRDKMRADFPLPPEPEMIVKLPTGISKLISLKTQIVVGHENAAFCTENAVAAFFAFIASIDPVRLL